MKKLAKWLLATCAIPLLFVFLLCIGGQGTGRASGLRMLNYIPPNLTPSVEICEVVQVSQASDLFHLPN